MAYLTQGPEFFSATQRLIERDIEPTFENVIKEMGKARTFPLTAYEAAVVCAGLGLLVGFVIGQFIR